jgi:PAS domain S-box-containing protein
MNYSQRNYNNSIRPASFVIFLLGVTVILGRLLDITLFKGVFTGYISMKFNTAICFILLGSALFLQTCKSTGICKLVIITFSSMVFVFSLLSFFEELFHYNLGIDQFFIRDHEINRTTQVYPGRMSPITAICFILLSTVLLSIKSEKNNFKIINQVLLHICTLISFIAILGYLFNTPEFYKLTFLTSMAIHTAVGIFIFSIAASLINYAYGITGLFTGIQVGNKVAKSLFFQIVIATLILGYFHYLSNVHYLVSGDFSLALYALSFILICFFLIWRTSRTLNTMESERKNAEDNFFSISMFLDLTPDPIIIVDEKGSIQIINNQTEAIFGYSKEELVGKKIELLMPNRFQPQHESHRENFFHSPTIRGMGNGVDLYAVKKNGVEFPVEISLSPIKTESGTLVAAAIRDITLRKEEEIKISELAAIIENSADAIISKTMEGIILTWNKGAEKILGYTFQEVYKKHISFLFPVELLAEEKIIMSNISKGEYIDQYETIRIKKDQTQIHVSITISPIKDKNGKVVGVSKILRDITKNKETEDKLRKYAILESKSKEMEQFAYVASHDLREPLLTIKNYMKLFLKNYGEAVDEESKRYIESVVKAADRMDILIRGILDYSRLSQLKEFVQVDTALLVEEVQADLHSLIHSTHAKITVDPLPVIKGYVLELKLLFQNLITNAIKFRKKDRDPEIYISASKVGAMWEFQVRDNGIGIAEENKEKVFHMFKKLHNKNEYEGTGIGLAYCKKIIELHNGIIFIESTPGEGSNFKFTILT